jgi:hypothetical protein
MSDEGKVGGGQPIIIDDDPGGIGPLVRRDVFGPGLLRIRSAVSIEWSDNGTVGRAYGYTTRTASVYLGSANPISISDGITSATIAAPQGSLTVVDTGKNVVTFICSDPLYDVSPHDGSQFPYWYVSQTVGPFSSITVIDGDEKPVGAFKRGSELVLFLDDV